MLNSGEMMPSPAKPERSEKMPKPITTMPDDLKNNGACVDCANDNDVNERAASTGSVPSAKKSIMLAPPINEPEDSA